MLKYRHDYVDKGMEFYQRRYQQQQINWMHKKAKDLGLASPSQWPQRQNKFLGSVQTESESR
jgi:hypothetical protein